MAQVTRIRMERTRGHLTETFLTRAQLMAASVAAMKALTDTKILANGQMVIVADQYRGGIFVYDNTLASFDEGYTYDATNLAGGFRKLYGPTQFGRWNVIDFGADPTGASNDTAAFTAAIAALGTSPGVLYVPEGSFNVAVNTIRLSYDRQHMAGDGPQASIITFTGASANGDTAVHVERASAAVCYQGSLSGFTIKSADTTYQKIGIKLVDCSGMVVHNIAIGPIGAWTGANSEGIQTQGREHTKFYDLDIAADLPVHLKDNPNHSIDSDHYHFSDCILRASGNPCFRIASGINVTNLTIDGYQSWNGGTGGLVWVDTATVQQSKNIELANIRWEQGASGYAVDIQHNHGITGLSMRGLYTGSGATTNGYRLRKITGPIIQQVHYDGTGVALDMDSTCASIHLAGLYANTGSTVTMTDLTQIMSLSEPLDGTYETDPHAYWEPTSTATKRVKIGGQQIWAATGTLADDATLNLQANVLNGAQRAGTLFVRMEGATVFEYAQYEFTDAAARLTLTPLKSTNTAAADTDGNLCVYQSGATITIKNRLAESVTYDYEIRWRE